ncbi:hypothetical protein [uncultured Subdoligranulum sp.]|uniref:helix-turn-helix domain-containing protein n=1 Tax=uncultured Subdoligranulum sp. TaxID=512298 RepID=UPI00262C95D2|nr:hypothetical protein [uncultured Subdoligranulum sp.]
MGVSTFSISVWSRGECTPNLSNIKRISEATGIPLEWILNGTTESPPEQQPVEDVPDEEELKKIRETDYVKATHSTDFRLILNGTYSGEALAHLISGLLADQKYTVNINVEA